MDLKTLQSAMVAAMKNRDKDRKESISVLIQAVKKAGIDAGCREEIPEDMVVAAILKEVKTVKEQIDTCPDERADLKEKYQARYDVFMEFAPKMLSAEEIEAELKEKFSDVLASGNKGAIMKAVMPAFKGRADGKLINQIVAKLSN
ncbi:MAG: GatB/YqeY domain-containing protein [Lachnospiraceae bacterium]|nr:GatB/YqeY domain-containing protein [Lachnospiraceae bacterium]